MFLTFVVVLICAFILSTYRESIYFAFKYKKFTKGRSVPFVLLGLVIVPVLIMNLFFSERYFQTPIEQMEFGERQEKEMTYHVGFEKYADQNKEKTIIQLKYLHYYFEGFLGNFSCGVARRRYNKDSLQASKIASLYIAVKCEAEKLSESAFQDTDLNSPGANYVKGLYYARRGDYEQAVQLLRKETSISPNFKFPYVHIERLLKKLDSEKYDQFMLDQASYDHLNYSLKEYYYFKEGHWGAYFTNIFVNRTFSTPLFVMFIAFVVSFIWLFYLRLMDVYNRERWINIFIVFLLGGLFTNFCLPFYDFAYYDLGFSIKGDAWNDFWYCVLVIGGSEELVKLIPWLIFGFMFKRLKEPFDYVLYASVSALGFAFIENFTYLESYNSISSRAIISSVAHMFDAVIVAYAFIIIRFRMKNEPVFKKIGVVILGFLLAMLAHGFYDFWLLSNAVNGFQFFTYIFFILSLHVWFFFKKNAMNHSPFFAGNERFNVKLQLDALYIGVIGIVMFQYVVIALEYGVRNVDYFFYREAGIAGVFLFYMTNQLNNFKLARGVWSKFSMKDVIPSKRLGQIFSRISEFSFGSMRNFGNEKSDETLRATKDLRGLQLRLFAPKSNRYIGSQLPVSGYCSKRITISGHSDWHLFRLNTAVYYQDYISDQIIIKAKHKKDNLLRDKIEIYFLFIPSPHILQKDSIRIEDLRAAGKCYSRPKNAKEYV